MGTCEHVLHAHPVPLTEGSFLPVLSIRKRRSVSDEKIPNCRPTLFGLRVVRCPVDDGLGMKARDAVPVSFVEGVDKSMTLRFSSTVIPISPLTPQSFGLLAQIVCVYG